MKRSKVLIVAPSPSLALALSQWLLPRYDVVPVSSYGAARAQLDAHPDAVVTPVRLADFNGLQVALYARAMHIPAIVIEVDDPVLQRDARQFGVTHFSSDDLSRERLHNALEAAIVPTSDDDGTAGIGWLTFTEPGVASWPQFRRLLAH